MGINSQKKILIKMKFSMFNSLILAEYILELIYSIEFKISKL